MASVAQVGILTPTTLLQATVHSGLGQTQTRVPPLQPATSRLKHLILTRPPFNMAPLKPRDVWMPHPALVFFVPLTPLFCTRHFIPVY